MSQIDYGKWAKEYKEQEDYWRKKISDLKEQRGKTKSLTDEYYQLSTKIERLEDIYHSVSTARKLLESRALRYCDERECENGSRGADKVLSMGEA